MPHPPPRDRPLRSLKRWRARTPADRLNAELDELRATIAALQAEQKPLAERVTALSKSVDAQRRRIDAVAATQERAHETAQGGAGPIAKRADGLRAMAARLRGRLTKRAPAPAVAPRPAPAVDWIMAGGKVAPGARAVLVVLFGLDAAAREVVVRRLTSRPPGDVAPLLPVFLTGSSDFTPMRQARAAFEYLPLRDGDREGGRRRDWQLYAVRRFAGVCAKWQPVQVVAFGAAAARQLAQWRASPHLPAAVKDLLAVAPDSAIASP